MEGGIGGAGRGDRGLVGVLSARHEGGIGRAARGWGCVLLVVGGARGVDAGADGDANSSFGRLYVYRRSRNLESGVDCSHGGLCMLIGPRDADAAANSPFGGVGSWR
jgi:hypothetical protein